MPKTRKPSRPDDAAALRALLAGGREEVQLGRDVHHSRGVPFCVLAYDGVDAVRASADTVT